MAEFPSSVGSGKDYPDLIAYEAGEQTSIGSGDQYVAEMYGEITASSGCSFTGWTVADSTARVIIRPAAGEEHTGLPGTGAKYTKTGTSDAIVNDGGMNMTFFGMDLFASTATTVVAIIKKFGAGSNIIDSCFVHGESAASATGIEHSDSSVTNNGTEVVNSVFFDIRWPVDSASADHVSVKHCTAIDHALGFENTVDINCLSLSGSIADYLTPSTLSDYNVSSDTTAPTTIGNYLHSKTAYTDYFTDYAGNDYSLKATTGDGGIFGATGLSGNDAGVSVDMLGNARTLFDLGAFESGGGGGGGGGAAADNVPGNIGIGMGL